MSLRRLGHRYALPILSAAAGFLAFALPAYSGQFAVYPISIEFSRPGEVTLLTVRNADQQRLRFQVEAFAWEQNADGTLKLTDTDDILYFPQLFELAPGATQNIRVGTTATPGPNEKNYRIFIEQFPVAATAVPAVGRGAAIHLQVVPKVGVPIFIRPSVVTKELTVGDIAVANGLLSFDLRNPGTVHLIPSKIRVEGRGGSGAAVFSREQPGWYILAGGVREYRLSIPPSDCASLSDISIQVATPHEHYEGNATVAPGACVPGAGAGAR